MMKGIKSMDASIVAAKTNVCKGFRSDFAAATNFLSGLISNIHSAAQLDYANRHSGKKRYISTVDSRDQHGGRGRFRRGGRSGERGRGGDGRGRGGRGGSRRMQINGVDMSRIPRETLRLTSGNALVQRDRTLRSSVPVLDGVVVLAVATVTVTVTVTVTGNVMRVLLTLPVTVIPSLPLTVNRTLPFRSADRRMAVALDAAHTTADSRMVLVANDRSCRWFQATVG